MKNKLITPVAIILIGVLVFSGVFLSVKSKGITGAATASNIFYCCNTNRIWQSNSCWAHGESWCINGDAKKTCSQQCVSKGFSGGQMQGTSEGTDANRQYYCKCTSSCTSSDGWHNYAAPGRTIGLSYDGKTPLNVVDTCRLDSKLQEFDCLIKNGQNTGRIEEVNYPNGIDCNSVIPGTTCKTVNENGVTGGACKSPYCTDSDDINKQLPAPINNPNVISTYGYNPSVRDTTKGVGAYDHTPFEDSDQCYSEQGTTASSCVGSKCKLNEIYCAQWPAGMTRGYYTLYCPKGCYDGICIS